MFFNKPKNVKKNVKIPHCATKIIVVERVCKDSTLFIDRVEQQNWHFEETLLDTEHSVCTAFKGQKQMNQEPILSENCENSFSFVTCETLLSALQPITNQDDQESSETWKNFCQKFEKKPF